MAVEGSKAKSGGQPDPITDAHDLAHWVPEGGRIPSIDQHRMRKHGKKAGWHLVCPQFGRCCPKELLFQGRELKQTTKAPFITDVACEELRVAQGEHRSVPRDLS